MHRADLAEDFPTIIEKSVVWFSDRHNEYRCSYVVYDMMERTELRENFEPLSLMLFHLQDMKAIQKHVSKWPPCAIDKLIQCHRERENAEQKIAVASRIQAVYKPGSIARVNESNTKRIKPPARPAPSRPPEVKKKVIPAPPKVAFIMRKSVVALASELKMTYLEAHEEFGGLTDKDIVDLYREMRDFTTTETNGRFSL
jgi:hypothetical protein